MRRISVASKKFESSEAGFGVFESIERAKRDLSERDATEVRFDYPTIDLREPITRHSFEVGSARRTAAILDKLDDVVRAAGVRREDVDVVCATGGTAKVPAIAAALRARFGAERLQQFQHFHSIVLGLAEEARVLAAQAA